MDSSAEIVTKKRATCPKKKIPHEGNSASKSSNTHSPTESPPTEHNKKSELLEESKSKSSAKEAVADTEKRSKTKEKDENEKVDKNNKDKRKSEKPKEKRKKEENAEPDKSTKVAKETKETKESDENQKNHSEKKKKKLERLNTDTDIKKDKIADKKRKLNRVETESSMKAPKSNKSDKSDGDQPKKPQREYANFDASEEIHKDTKRQKEDKEAEKKERNEAKRKKKKKGESVVANIKSIVKEISQAENASIRFALVEYRDHPPQDPSFVVKTSPWTESVDEMFEYVNNMRAAGGGDPPEAVTDALHEALNLEYRPEAVKVCILIADAPPHGLEPVRDAWPDGCPCGNDPLQILREMARKDIVLYAVGVEPALGWHSYGRDFMFAAAKLTGGRMIPLTSARLLASVIIGGSIEEISLKKLEKEIENEISEIVAKHGGKLTEEELVKLLTNRLKEKDVKTNQLHVDDVYGEYKMDNVIRLVKAPNLQAVRSSLLPELNKHILIAKEDSRPTASSSYSYSSVSSDSSKYSAIPTTSTYSTLPKRPKESDTKRSSEDTQPKGSSVYTTIPSRSSGYGSITPRSSSSVYTSIPVRSAGNTITNRSSEYGALPVRDVPIKRHNEYGALPVKASGAATPRQQESSSTGYGALPAPAQRTDFADSTSQKANYGMLPVTAEQISRIISRNAAKGNYAEIILPSKSE